MNRNYGGRFSYRNAEQQYYYQQDYHPGFVPQAGDQFYHHEFYDPGYHHQPGYLAHPGYPGQPEYPSYPTQGYGLAYYGDNSQQAYQANQSYERQNDNVNVNAQTAPTTKPSATTSKHSYSQNRFKGRQNMNRKQDGSSELEVDSAKAGGPNDKTEVKGESSRKQYSEKPGNDQTDLAAKNESGGHQKQREVGDFRRGRFHGSDSRTRAYDQRQQVSERKQNYNRNFNARSNEDTTKAGSNDKENHTLQTKSAENNTAVKIDTRNFQQNNKGKSYKDARKGSNRYDRADDRRRPDRKGDSLSSGALSESSKPTHTDVKPADFSMRGKQDEQSNKKSDTDSRNISPMTMSASLPALEDSGDVDRSKSAGARKKRREIQVYSSRGPMDNRDYGQGRNSPREMSNRYNYRGQDYNKRHKDTMVERGGSQTKLSVTPVEELDALALDQEGEEEKEDKSVNDGLKRGTRAKATKKVDESQREVLIDQLTRGKYECMVCCESVRAQNAVWSCGNCYHMFHLRCIKRWARSPNSVVTGAEKDGWRCPACQNLSFKFPNQYRCFCGKVRDPEVSRMETPHSCGDVCQKSRGEDCKHPCNILCHPGPCPECTASITKSCDCGKSKQTAVCGQSTVIKCERVCEKQLNCGRHFCRDKCHAGPCQKCQLEIKQECYGQHETREIICGSEPSFTESYSCPRVCSQVLDCGEHQCERLCHSGPCHSCPMLPSNVTQCPCGAMALQQLDAESRTSCKDPVATCSNICDKLLNCGPPESHHRCKEKCHEGPCGQCEGSTILSCRCDCMEKEVKCSEVAMVIDENGQFLCDKRCNKKKQCGRHKCGQLCCVLEEHPCEMLCGRKLPCGLHKCTEPCHRNNCPPCLMAGFDELTCHCGSEVLFPPTPCGTRPPECHRPCTRQHTCDHTVRHNCHSEEQCPPCTELTSKKCMGNHIMRTNIPCHLTDISCGMKCSKPLPCGEHFCIRTCHKGPCLEEGQLCTQPCQRKRERCNHACGAECHGEAPCPGIPCKAPVQVRCACGRREMGSTCSVGVVATETQDFQRMTMQTLRESLQGSMGTSTVNISKFNQAQIGHGRVLECNEECALLERNKRMASALEIQNPDLTAKPNTLVYSDFLKDYVKKDTSFVAGIEKSLSDLVQSAKSSKRPSRSHPFPVMNQSQRRVVHELAEHYGCQTLSYDFEPKKNVVATASKDKCWLPTLSLTSLVQRELLPRAPPPIPHLHKEETTRLTNLASKPSSLIGEGASMKGPGQTQPLSDGWQVIGKKSSKKTSSSGSQKSAIGTIDKFEESLENVCPSGVINYSALSSESKEALKAEPVVDYFDFTVS